MFLKGYIRKTISALLLSLSAVSMVTVPASAASYPETYVIMGLGRTNVMLVNSGSSKFEAIGEISSYTDFAATPVLYNGATYVPFRYVMEKAGFNIGWANNAITIKRKNRQFNVWSKDDSGKVKKRETSAIEYSSGVFSIANGNISEKIDIAPMATLFGKTYISVRELEKLGFIIYWDGKYSTVHILYDDDRNFVSKVEDILKAKNADAKLKDIETYINNFTKKNSYTEDFNFYISSGTEYNNYSNNALAISAAEGEFVSVVKESKDKKKNAIGEGSRQLTYCEYGNKKFIYYVDNKDKKIYKVQVSKSSKSGSASKVALPASLNGKKFTQLIINGNRLFFIAYDNAADGGYVYMAGLGNEANTTVKLTNVRAWNIALTPNNELYFTNLEKGDRLYSIDFKDLMTANAIYNNSGNGVGGTLVRDTGIQSLAISLNEKDLYYYTDTATGSVMESKNGATKEIIKAQNGNILMNFLNLKETSKEKALYFIEYANGRIKDFKLCKIKKYNLETGAISEIYVSDKMIMQLTIVGDDIFFTDEAYSALYKINSSAGGYTFNEL